MLAAVLLFASLTGAWVFDVQTDAGSGSPTFTFKQDGEKLTGRYSGQLGEAEVQGTVKGDSFTFEFTIEQGGQGGKIVYTGAILADGRLKGRVSLAGLAEGTFTARRKQ